jgi:hypothetical protein
MSGFDGCRVERFDITIAPRCKIDRGTARKVHPRGKGPVSNDSIEKEADDSEGSSSSRTSSYSRRKQKKQKTSKGHKFEEFRKAKPPSFDGEIKKGEEAEA